MPEAPRELHWAAGRPLHRVVLDLAGRRTDLCLEGGTVVLEGVHSTTLLSPWDGSLGRVEWLRIPYEAPGHLCVELRVMFGVPRMFRVVCESLREERA